MSKLILLRHGQSEWNKANLFTGWVDVPLSEEGVIEAQNAGKKLRDLPIHVVITTPLIRAQMTAMLALIGHSSGKTPVIMHPDEKKMNEWGRIYSKAAYAKIIPVYRAWELNERMYGELQGLNKAETAEKFGKNQVHKWRRSYDSSPPEGESLAMTAARAVPYFKERIIPYLQEGRTVLVSAHGNSLRAITMYVEGLNKDELLSLEVPTGEPIIYTFDSGNFNKTAFEKLKTRSSTS